LTRKKNILRSLLTFAFIAVISFCHAQDSSVFFRLDKEEILIANAQNLEELLALIPGLSQYTLGLTTHTSFSTLDLSQIAIIKDDYPLLMDQNVGYDLQSIPVWDLEYIEVSFSPISTLAKNSTIVIRLYTKKFLDQPFWIETSATNTTANDLHANVLLGLSNKVHTLQAGLGRSFTGALYDSEGLRSTAVGGAERYDMNLQYKYQILKSMELNIRSDNSRLSVRNKGSILPGLSRVQDINQRVNRHLLFGSLKTQVSKNHTLTLDGQIHRLKNEISLIDKDLNSGISDQNHTEQKPLSTGFDYGSMRLKLDATQRQLNYSMGIELSNTSDNTYATITGIRSSYGDYTAFGNISYQYRNTVRLEGGARLLNNSLTGSYLLPSVKLTLAPQKELQISGTYSQTISYPNFKYQFYPTGLTGEAVNNMLLKPRVNNTLHIKLTIDNPLIKGSTGILHVRSADIPRTSENNTYTNAGKSTSTTTYASLNFSNDFITIKPSALIHGSNYLKDTSGFNFFHPEINIFTQLHIPNTFLDVGFIGRFLGKNTSSVITDNTIYQEEQNGTQQLSAYLRYKLFAEKLHLSLSITNIYNEGRIARDTYLTNEIDRELIGTAQTIVAKPITYAIRIAYAIL
jgi:hypothetical protein